MEQNTNDQRRRDHSTRARKALAASKLVYNVGTGRTTEPARFGLPGFKVAETYVDEASGFKGVAMSMSASPGIRSAAGWRRWPATGRKTRAIAKYDVRRMTPLILMAAISRAGLARRDREPIS